MEFSLAFVVAIVLATQAAAYPAQLDARTSLPSRDCPPRERAIALLEAVSVPMTALPATFTQPMTIGCKARRRAATLAHARHQGVRMRRLSTARMRCSTYAIKPNYYTADSREREQWLKR
ncbi:hypothetical protein HGRIS_003205 [Hohenbuehelia grisea]|uniref:Antifreeze protein n=1 Tax=Hohenbuehelia grisea TaxID=104357 RepID=A0ABR3JNH9_9AGAR